MNILTKVFMCLKTQMQTAKFIQTTNCFTAKSDLQVNLNKNNLKQIYIYTYVND